MPSRSPSFDSLDYQIILALHKNARASAAEIARRIGANERTVRKRIEHLVQSGAMRLTAILEPSAFGYVTAADIFLEVESQHEEEVLKRLMEMPMVTYVAFGQGTQEVSIEARFKDNDELREFIRHVLPSLPGVTVTRYTLVPRILRNIDEWLPPPEDFVPSE
ncbi:MAG: AsnC family transcriptional regulator [Anaerolineales bacterium]|nr:AsnC family transcriptional regulator [Anaerolineales bacterium]MCS7247451.1 AsnC family transcriptional regulator [Anaerolineales bacterium]MDW8161262.1 AsnC family transcriptional regulator [Anaerolineales bacterium]MDW8447100.1 AsnC family transcriptional regulator [Anaerolineales bacterium]